MVKFTLLILVILCSVSHTAQTATTKSSIAYQQQTTVGIDHNLLNKLENLGERLGENNFENDNNEKQEKGNDKPGHIVVSFSHNALENIWGIFLMIIIVHASLFACWYNKHTEQQVVHITQTLPTVTSVYID
eukprot:124422_1